LDLIIQSAQQDLNFDVKTKGVLALAQAYKTLVDAENPQGQQGIPPEIQAQIAQQESAHGMQLKELELQANLKLKAAELQMKQQATMAKIQSDQQVAGLKAQTVAQDAQIKAAQAEQAMQQQAEAHQVDQAVKVADAQTRKEQAKDTPKKEG
jgi:hypothetical protein